ncbi:MAG TPA: lamin tail domain-containing protein, partial [Chryseosolibacter sp.]
MNISCKISFNPTPGLRAKTFAAIWLIDLLTSLGCFAQIADDFSDGDFTSNPSWMGTGDFIVNSGHQLQLNASVAGSSYLYVGLPLTGADDFQWEFYLRHSFSSSGGNFGRFYLMSDEPDLRGPLNGYYLQFGEAGSEDAVELFRQSGTTSVSVCRATAAAIASAFQIRVKVNRTSQGLWELYIDYTGNSDFTLEASASDTAYSSSLYSGIFCTYTVTNATRFYYDDFSMKVADLADSTPPQIVSLQVTSPQTLDVLFSESIDRQRAENSLNYYCYPLPGNPSAAVMQTDERTVRLSFPAPFTNGEESTLRVTDISDVAGNVMPATEKKFLYFKQEPVLYRDVIVTEILADPSPQVGIPAAEFVELYNRSANPVQLDGWSLSDGVSTGVFSPFILLPGKYAIASSPASVSGFVPYGESVSVSNFPTLNNGADHLKLADPTGTFIDSVNYSSSWYRDVDKAEGGWSLERIDPEDACADDLNWVASSDPAGGTPGKVNSVFEITPDTTGPKLLEAKQLSDTSIQLTFDERLAASTPASSAFLIQPEAAIVSVSFGDAIPTKINLALAAQLDTTKSYSINATNVFDCPGNPLQLAFSTVYLNRDVTLPFVVSAQATSSTSVLVSFSEKVSAPSSKQVFNYVVDGWGNPVSATLQPDEGSLVLSFTRPFPNGYERLLNIAGVTDLAGNVMVAASVKFIFFQPGAVNLKDVIVIEICADPSPPQGLPEAEFVELYNRGEYPIDLSGWTISDGTTTGLCDSLILPSNEYVILASPAAAAKFGGFGKTVSVSAWPSLNNLGDLVWLRDPAGRTIDSLNYDISWYGDPERTDGGWSLELIDPENICAEKGNWAASEHPSGGTPGKQNSVYANKPDNTGPKLVSAHVTGSLALQLEMNEKLERQTPRPEQFVIEPLLPVERVAFGDASLTTLTLLLSTEVQPGISYRLFVKDIYDCAGNKIQDGFSQAVFLLPEKANEGDVVVNEILFNPRPTGVDFVEIYNRSLKTIDLKNWSIRNFRTAAEETVLLSADVWLIHPHEYRVLTEDGNTLKGEYVMGIEETFLETRLPAFNDDEGSVSILNEDGMLIDSMHYSS